MDPRHLLVGLAMLAAAGLAIWLTPSQQAADQMQQVNLETMFPREFGEWRMVEEVDRSMVSPDVQAKLDRIYNQTLARTYVSASGERVMLAVAYGSNQTDSMKVHLPEVCYPSQGFEILYNDKDRLVLNDLIVQVKHLVARQGSRIEPVTYWIAMGNRTVAGDLDRRLVQIRFGLAGVIPEGYLFRVSSLDSNRASAFAVQARFIQGLHASMTATERGRIFGAQVGQ
jgi:EpsI family protein